MNTKAKASYKVCNWKEYDSALKLRGSITFWVNEEVVEQWRNENKTGRKGASIYYSDVGNDSIGISSTGTTSREVFGAGRPRNVNK